MRRKGWVAALLLLALMLSGCRPLVSDAPKPLTVYATFYPIYALTDAVARGVPDMTLHCLTQPQDGCLRSYALSDWDIYLLSTADAVIAGGRGLEAFESGLFAMGEKGPAVSAVLYNLELINTRQTHGGAEAESHLDGPNPHLYMSVEGAKRIVESIAATLQTLDPGYDQTYIDNAAAAVGRLDELQSQAREITGDLSGKKVILMSEALIYVAKDYGLEVAGQFDREPGAALYGDDLAACLEALKAFASRVVLIEKQAPAALIRALEAAGYLVARIDNLSTHREDEGFGGYIEAQLNNARAVRRAFDGEDGA
ncbi:MAG: zinc ABC transporter substrate-binding protein [Clostridia bacterium]|nr:zinc ABC transporter substrate-binding protein [Clostridia bacterium]